MVLKIEMEAWMGRDGDGEVVGCMNENPMEKHRF